MKTALVLGAGGFIGNALAARLVAEGYVVRGLSRRAPPEGRNRASFHEYHTIDLRYLKDNDPFFSNVDEVYQLACEVGGLGYIANHDNDAEIARNSTLIDIAVLEACRVQKVPRIFFASSACVYNSGKRLYAESDAYPANCANEFAWQKLYAERLYLAYARAYGLEVRIGRLFNTYGPGMTWKGGREKSVAALCRKVAQAKHGDVIEIWGNGHQTRSFTYIDDAVEGIWRVMHSDIKVPVNIGPAQEVSIDELVGEIFKVAGKKLFRCYDPGRPSGVSKICSDNTLIRAALGWEPKTTIEEGLKKTYPWVEKMVLDAKAKT